MRILLSIILNALTLYVLAFFLEKFPDNTGVIIANGTITYDDIRAIKTYITGGLILGLINLTIKPILKILTLPLFLIFLSFVTLIINAIILYLLNFIFEKILIIDGIGYQINGGLEFVIAVVIFTILNIFYSILAFKK